MIYYKTKQYELANQNVTNSIELLKSDYGANHPSLAPAYNNLGLVLLAQ